MQKKLDYIFAGVIILLGGFHTVATILFQRPADLDFMMYVGSGMAFLLAGVLNLPMIKSSSHLLTKTVFLTNCAFVIFMIFITVEVADARAFSVVIAFIWVLVSVVIDLNRMRKII